MGNIAAGRCRATQQHRPCRCLLGMSKKKMQRELCEAEREHSCREATSKQRGTAGEGRGILPFVVRDGEEADTVTGRAGLPLVVEAFHGDVGSRRDDHRET